MPIRPSHVVVGFDTGDADSRIALAREWDDLVARVRRLPLFGDFLRPPRLETLRAAAANGPVVILNVSRWGCDALIVRAPGAVDVEVVALPDLTAESVAAQVRSYLAAVGVRGGRDLVPLHPADDVDTQLTGCLRWLWHSVTAPVLDRLGYRSGPAGAGGWPRVWWCPTGPMTLLPVHAAGDHETAGEAVLDRVISSYTPTLRALVEARSAAPTAGRGRMLFVGMPETPGQPDLPDVRREETLLAELFQDQCTRRVGPAATRAAVLADLPAHCWVHFACHGEQRLDDPSRGGLHVQDGALTVTDLSAQPYRGEFAYLSGCKTAVGGVDLPDEAITLAAALHYTGFRHVIATLWTVGDEPAAQVAADVYAALVRDGDLTADDAAPALHAAVRRLRDAHRDRPSVWMPFAHIGP